MPSKVNSPKVRAAIYARYSSDNQREASIEDQVEVCRRNAELQGWEIVEVYPDRALSGASRFRPAFHVNRQVPCTTLPPIALEQGPELRAGNSRAPAWP